MNRHEKAYDSITSIIPDSLLRQLEANSPFKEPQVLESVNDLNWLKTEDALDVSTLTEEIEFDLEDIAQESEYEQSGHTYSGWGLTGLEAVDEETKYELLENEALENQLESMAAAQLPSLISEDLSVDGYTCYVKIDLGKGNYTLDLTGIYAPSGFDPSKPVDAILYLHGMTTVFPGASARINEYWAVTRLPDYDLRIREEVNAANRNVLLIAPSLGKSPNAYTNYLSGSRGGLDSYLGNVLAAVNTHIIDKRFKAARIDFRNVILAAHSAGGRQMRLIATHDNPLYGSKITECWGFDSLYSGVHEWILWGNRNPEKKLVLYYKSSTRNHAKQLEKFAAKLQNIAVVNSSARNHYWVPKAHFKERVMKLPAAFATETAVEAETPIGLDLQFETSKAGLNIYGERGGGRVTIKRDPDPKDIADIDSFRKIPIHRHTKMAWDSMVAAARTAGFQHPLLMPTSGYRSFAEQKKLWEEALRKYGSESEARKWVAKPGGSAHQSGRALDLYLGTKNNKESVPFQRQTAIYKWLKSNAENFGFYPYEAEPWHWEHNPLPGSEVKSPAVSAGTTVGTNPVNAISIPWASSSIDFQKAVRLNEKYGRELGWFKNVYEINDLLLEATGQSGMSLGPEAFAHAVAQWQQQNGFRGKDVDGTIGPSTWAKMSAQLRFQKTQPARRPG